MVSTESLQSAIDLIEKSTDILITTHTKPDGDACGCMVAMCDVLTSLGKQAQPLMLTPVPKWYGFLFEHKAPVLNEDITLEQLQQQQFDLVLIVDTNSRNQLGKFAPYLEGNEKPVLIIDHHATADGLGTVDLTDSTAAATGQVLLELFKHAEWPINRTIAEALFVAIATDTGWFRFNNTDARVYAAGAELTEAGANPTSLYDRLFNTFSSERFKLMVTMLNSLELHFDGRYAAQHLTCQDFKDAGATYSDSENLINECHRIESVRASTLFIELADGRIRCSLRSRGALDVSEIAGKFGGGGHKMASGTFLPGPLDHAKKLIYEEIAARKQDLDA